MKKEKNFCIVRNVYPELDGGRYPVKTEIDRIFIVSADIVFSENKMLSVSEVYLKYRNKRLSKKWNKVEMQNIGWQGRQSQRISCDMPWRATESVRWRGEIKFDLPGIYEYTIEVESALPPNKIVRIEYEHILELVVDLPQARFANWYEMFHRSQGKIPNKSATFKDCEERLIDIKSMGFNVIYLPPIHPIGRTNRKGPNNSVNAGTDDPGCPWAIGNEQGGHKSVNLELGTLDDFEKFVHRAKEFGIEIALDIAFNCSYDHPYVKEHPGWFFWTPDGQIRFAENPPKKYEDVCMLNFYPKDRQEMWDEMKDIFVFWINCGVKIFRVDNPHTKPTEFWTWVIKEIKKEYPEVIFFAEAFTYYEKLEGLAKAGFTQSYTYFTWRNNKNELLEYFTKLTQSDLRQFLRANLFVNTPDICPPIIQTGGVPAFKMRAALASTLSSLYGIYNGYELCEADAFPGTEIYRNSEKYQYKVWDWNRPGNIKDYISKLNRVREENPALHYYDNLRFHESTNDNVMVYSKISPDGKNIIITVVNLDVKNIQDSRLTLPLEEFGIGSGEEYNVLELITGNEYTWKGRENYVRLDPYIEPVYIFRVEKSKKSKQYKIDSSSESSRLAKQHGEEFFRLREKVIKDYDFYARRDFVSLYYSEIIRRVYTGPTYDRTYEEEINKVSRQYGYLTIINAYMTTAGH